jgi:hypothetical protein
MKDTFKFSRNIWKLKDLNVKCFTTFATQKNCAFLDEQKIESRKIYNDVLRHFITLGLGILFSKILFQLNQQIPGNLKNSNKRIKSNIYYAYKVIFRCRHDLKSHVEKNAEDWTPRDETFEAVLDSMEADTYYEVCSIIDICHQSLA